ncbi:hypothetical protein ACIBMZ_30435 [Micromonospora sp. NPDC049900]|uniref:hypothetical protein n=1 Tax=Micromonospora sp. NPDC049900 TaxID=3364275 RepID=UPI0037AFCC77
MELYLPLGALARVDRRVGGYPFDESSGVESLTWRSPLDWWLADIAIAVHGEVPFHRALIGFEVDDDHGISGDQRYHTVLMPSPDGIKYRPANT